MDLIASTFFGLEKLLAKELTRLGAKNVETHNRAVSFRGDKRLLYKSNFHLRTALRILRPLQRFQATSSMELYRGVRKMRWHRFVAPEGTIAVTSVVTQSQAFNNSHYVAQRVKDAVCDDLRKKSGVRPSVDTENPDLRLNIHIHQQRATLSVDASGEPLYKRGYRIAGGAAPLNECLAAGILLLSGWKGQTPLVDPMCGSGTFLIEGSMIARKMAPGLVGRDYGFMKWKDFDADLYEEVKQEAEAAALEYPPAEIVGADIDEKVLVEARSNTRRARVARGVRLEQGPFTDFQPPAAPGTMVSNPPYGERMQLDDAARLYKELGDTLKHRYAGYNCNIITGNPEAAQNIGLRAKAKIPLYNGKIECRLLRYDINEAPAPKQEDDAPEQ
jgi:putative N6-adenine-specific DNA methylase